MTRMKPVSVQVIAYAPTAFYHCQHCELAFQEMGIGERIRLDAAASSLPDDLVAEYQALSDWIHALLERHRGAVRLSLIDAASIEGFVASLRHRLRRYPAVVVDGHEKVTGMDVAGFDAVVERHLVERRVADARVGPGAAGERRDGG